MGYGEVEMRSKNPRTGRFVLVDRGWGWAGEPAKVRGKLMGKSLLHFAPEIFLAL